MSKPRIGEDLQPLVHGATWGEGVVLKGISQGEGIPAQLGNPKRGLPLRGVSGHGASPALNVEGGKIYATPDVPEGQTFTVVAEY